MRTRQLALVLGVTALASATLGGVVATAQTPVPRGGTVHVIDYGDGEGVGGTIVLTGAIGDTGSTHSVSANVVEVSLIWGSFQVNVAGFDKKIDAAYGHFAPNPNTCSGTVSAIGGVPIVPGSGTGAYSGISGGFTLGMTFSAIAPKYATGPHKGQCNFSNSSATVGQAQVIMGSGTVSFS